MNRNHPLSELESLLRRIKPTVAVREAHKHELRQRLLVSHESKFSYSTRFVYAGMAIVLLVSLALFTWKQTPVIGVLTENDEERSIHNRREYEFEESATVRLVDSELRVAPGSRIAIDTSYVYSDTKEMALDSSARTVVRLMKGDLDIRVEKRSNGQRYWVETPNVRVQVTGTRFQVTVERE